MLFFYVADANLAPGSVVFTNGMPYAYHNGMAFFPQVDGSFNVNQAQVCAMLTVCSVHLFYCKVHFGFE